MNTDRIIKDLSERFPQCAALLRVNNRVPHEAALISDVLHNYMTAADAFTRAAAELNTSVRLRRSVSHSAELLIERDAVLEARMMILIPIERGLTEGHDVERIREALIDFSGQSAHVAPIPRSTSLVDNARGLKLIEEWRRIAMEIRLS